MWVGTLKIGRIVDYEHSCRKLRIERACDAMTGQGRSHSVSLLLPILACALLVSTVACGGNAYSSTPPPLGGPVLVPACVNGTVAGYLGTSCSQPAGQVYHWSSYACTSTPASICTNLGSNGANLQMEMDPNGNNTILVGRTSLWNVTAGQSVDVVIGGTIYGGNSNQNWPHFNGLNGQTGDGTEENITTVGCGGNCLDARNGVSDILCSAGGPAANCTNQSTIAPYSAYYAHFNPATSANPYPLTIEIKLNGNSGTATLFSVGTHLGKATN